MAMKESSGATFGIGVVFSETFESIGRNFVVFALLAILIAIPQQGLQWYFSMIVSGTIQPGNPAAFGALFGTGLATLMLSIFLIYFLQAAITFGAVSDLNGRPVSLGACLGASLGAFLPLIAIFILAMLGEMVGMILLVVPGVILALGWSLVVPVRVVERTGIVATLGRSWALTSGYKGTIFLIFLLFGIGSIAFQLAGSALAGVTLLAPRTAGVPLPLSYLVIMGIITAAQAMVSAALTAAMYYQLRVVKEGIGPEQLAAVFD